ncbi:ATP-dependent helicase [Fusobacterium necrophorum subsp. funduliforme]|uniref:ATP-dependent DNA helicase n=1 Tax=Fusobacterium necrophorum TaxID=859 RepID=UPI00370E0427
MDISELSHHIPNFEYRKEQVDMMNAIRESLEADRKIVIEAGTGTGKTLAYLIPTLEWAIENKKKVICTTNTINLQEQLLLKDLPIAKKIINQNFSYLLVKGRNNYLCKRLFHNFILGNSIDISGFSSEQKKQLDYLKSWGKMTEFGDKAELPFEVDSDIWEMIQSSSEFCQGKRCPFREECFYMKNRALKASADLIVCNHHIFFADLNVRNSVDFDAEYLILPKYDVVVFDEAHNIESVARSYFSLEVSRYSFVRMLNQLQNQEKNKKRKILPALETLLQSLTTEKKQEKEFRQSLQAIEQEHVKCMEIGLDFFESLAKHFLKNHQGKISKSLQRDEMLFSPFLSLVREKKEEFILVMKAYSIALDHFYSQVKEGQEQNQYLMDFQNFTFKLKAFLATFQEIQQFDNDDFVYWIEANAKYKNAALVAAPLNIDRILKDSLFVHLERLIFTSATLAVNGDFSYFKIAVGLEEDTSEKMIPSPFFYDDQMTVYIPNDLTDPDKTLDFVEEVSEFLKQLLLKTEGKAFVLFTSYSSLNQIYYSMIEELQETDIHVLLHGEKPRSQLISEFKQVKNPVLFGTSSFWEGVDIQGEQLRNIVIIKLPFLVPSDPVVSAISAKFERQKRNPFMEYQLPEAVIKFKQGIGRLIRSKEDYGNIFILDNRILKKRYGKVFLDSIPSKNIQILAKNQILKVVK